MERLAAGLAHELTQPLTSIATDLEACATYVRAMRRAPAMVTSLIERAMGEALHAGEIVSRLRDFVQRGESRRETIDLREVVRNASRWLTRELEQHRIAIRLTLGRQVLPVAVDRVQMEQVFVNLLQNAVDAIVGARSERREVRVRASRTPKGTADVVVEDTGGGLSEVAVERAFEPFFTTKARGLGMGLAISRSAVEAHHGWLQIEPGKRGRGTTVRLALWLNLPARAGSGGTVRRASAPSADYAPARSPGTKWPARPGGPD
jgi:two-component system sensor kinase FixL